jgi:hypothetical protein
MADLGRAPAGRPMTLLWMVLALVIVGGFLAWLGVASEPTTVAVVEEDANNDENGTLTVVEREALMGNVGSYLGQRIRVRGVESIGRLGAGMFWGELGDGDRQAPVLVRMDTELTETVVVEPGVDYTIVGEVQQVSEELVNQWAAQGEFAGEGEQLQATFADYYIQASAVRPTRGARVAPGS